MIVVLGLVALLALALQAVRLTIPGTSHWSAVLAWALASGAAGAGTLVGGWGVRGRPVTRESWLLWGAGAGCWAAGVIVEAAFAGGDKPGGLFLVLPAICVFTYFRRVPRAFLFVLFLLDGIPVVLLIVALVVLAQHPGNVVFTCLFTGLYVLMAANAVQMIGIHTHLRDMSRTWAFTLAFAVMGFASLSGQIPSGAARGVVAAVSGVAWTVGMVLLTLAAQSRMLQGGRFVTLVPLEKQTGPHAIPPTAAVFGLILLVVLTPHPQVLLRAFLVSAAVLLVIRISLVYQQDVQLIAEVMGSRARLHSLAEVTSQLKSLVLDELLTTFCGSAREVTGARYAALGLMKAGAGLTRLVTSSAADAAAPGMAGFPAADPAADTVLHPSHPVPLQGPTSDPEVAGFRRGRPEADGFLALPVGAGSSRGVLYLAGKDGGFSPEDQNLAELLASSGDYAIVNAGLYAESQSQQEQLAIQNEQLRELDKLKDEFIALVSHELRTPLTSIIGYVELLKDEVPPGAGGSYRKFGEIIDRNAQRLLRLVGDLLFLSRIQTGKMDMDMRVADFHEVVVRAVGDAHARASKKKIDLSLSARPVAPLACDPERLAQVLDNLITNAIKFTPPGGHVEVRLDTEGPGVALQVADTGFGISAADRTRIFESFYRSENQAKNAIPGSGLGLAITKAIVDAHDGTIVVDSEEGKGTTFKVWIPRVPLSAPNRRDASLGHKVAPPARAPSLPLRPARGRRRVDVSRESSGGGPPLVRF